MKLPAYPRYKPSRVEWLGDVPEHWEVKRLKYILAAPLKYGVNEAAELDDPDLPRYVRITDINENDGLRKETFKSLPSEVAAEYLLRKGDLLFARSGATSGKTFLYRTNWGACAYAGYLIRARIAEEKAVPEFVRYFTASTCYWQWLSSAYIQATIQNVNAERYASLELPLPPVGEQAIIADFLDCQTAQIDTLLAKKRALIERLKEKRTALISRTVTSSLPPESAVANGLNPHPKVSPSRIDWIGDMPEHWEIKQLKWAVTFQRGHDLPADQREVGSVPLVTSSGVSATHSCAKASGPGIVTGRYGTIGEFYLITEDYWPLNTTLYSINLHGNDPRFLHALLQHLSPLFLLHAVKSAVPGVDRNDIHSIAVAVPPIVEQEAIVNFLNRETARLDSIVAKIETAIQRLQEYRTALITATVTGRIDVRKTAA